MRDSVYAQILWAIDKLGLTTKFKCTQSPLQCTYTPTGQRILFRGLDDPQKIKSIKLPFGYIGILWFEEATKSRAVKMRCAMCSSLRCAAVSLALLLSASTLRLPAATGRTATPARNARQARPSFDLPASPCCMARPEVSGTGGVHQGNAADEIPPWNIWRRSSQRYAGIENLRLEPISQKTIRNFDTIENGVDWGWYPDPWASTAATMMRHTKRCISSTN